ncbi:LOW QUALITY PROTEIN: endosome-associated-trafficking regulator 1-like [Haemorhous mexicanus]|uniref:LOW QUALITY PROTEIN: endosome-associated-trafficking regulator 1-like n=1 Tax=Haemorhous mexicanus TaxID=30427 RepID=UPI0028BF564F|nr:LOW QUALITY PROTEIN: endosome-associated-trafficking regulator 1-like [Haemorhous mexicanus]
MVYPESQGLQGDDDNNGGDDDSEESGNCHSDVPSPLCKSSHSTDENKTVDLGEPTLFPTPGDSYMVKDKQVGLAKHVLELEEGDQEFQEPFYKDMRMSDSLDGNEQPSLTYHLPGHRRLPAPQNAGTAPSGFRGSFQHSSRQHLGTEVAATQAHASEHYVGHPENTTGVDPHVLREEDGEDSEDRESLSLQPAYDSLWQENSMLRRMFQTFQNNLKRQVCMVASLQDQLKSSWAEREREVQELQSLVQETECHLQIMTQRALNAETNMERLKQKIFILQGQLERCKLENENLRTDWLEAVKHNLDFTRQNLHELQMGKDATLRQFLPQKCCPLLLRSLNPPEKFSNFKQRKIYECSSV